MSVAVTRAERALPANTEAERLSPWQVWGFILIAPYVLIFLTFVLYPVGYGLWVARHPQSYVALIDDPIFLRSGFFVQARPWIRWLSLIFILPWAVPSIPTILSVRFMLNPEWGLINHVIFDLTGDDGPN